MVAPVQQLPEAQRRGLHLTLRLQFREAVQARQDVLRHVGRDGRRGADLLGFRFARARRGPRRAGLAGQPHGNVVVPGAQQGLEFPAFLLAPLAFLRRGHLGEDQGRPGVLPGRCGGRFHTGRLRTDGLGTGGLGIRGLGRGGFTGRRSGRLRLRRGRDWPGRHWRARLRGGWRSDGGCHRRHGVGTGGCGGGHFRPRHIRRSGDTRDRSGPAVPGGRGGSRLYPGRLRVFRLALGRPRDLRQSGSGGEFRLLSGRKVGGRGRVGCGGARRRLHCVPVVRAGVQGQGLQERGGPQRATAPGVCRRARPFRGGRSGPFGCRGQQTQGRRAGQTGGQRLGIVAIRITVAVGSVFAVGIAVAIRIAVATQIRFAGRTGFPVPVAGRDLPGGGRPQRTLPGLLARQVAGRNGLWLEGRASHWRGRGAGTLRGRGGRQRGRSLREGGLAGSGLRCGRERDQPRLNAPGTAGPDGRRGGRDRGQEGAANRQGGRSGRRREGPGCEGAVLLGDGHLPGVFQAAQPLVENTHFAPLVAGSRRTGGPRRGTFSGWSAGTRSARVPASPPTRRRRCR